MKFQDKILNHDDYLKFEDEIKRLKVSIKARLKDNLVDEIKKKGGVENLGNEDYHKRRLYLVRSVDGYKKKPTHRRWLSLITYHYHQEPLDDDSKKLYEKLMRKEDKKE